MKSTLNPSTLIGATVLNAEHAMRYAVSLAKKGYKTVAPNPPVGAVILSDNKIIGSGFHERSGESHAEVHAINSVQETSLLSNSTLLVTLEPCSHTGKTPPCVDAILESKIPKVVFGSYDTSEYAQGGKSQLLKSGVEAIYLPHVDCEKLIAPWKHYSQEGKTTIDLVVLSSLNGLFAQYNKEMIADREVDKIYRVLSESAQGCIRSPVTDIAKYHLISDNLNFLSISSSNQVTLRYLHVIRVPIFVDENNIWQRMKISPSIRILEHRNVGHVIYEKYIARSTFENFRELIGT